MRSRHRLSSVPGSTPEDRAHQDGIFLQVARGLTFDGAVLTLVDLAPSTISIGSGDPSSVGYLSTGDFLDEWSRWRREHEERQARGVVSLMDPAARLADDPELFLHSPRIYGSGLAYDVESVKGLLPRSTGSCVLLIEPSWDH